MNSRINPRNAAMNYGRNRLANMRPSYGLGVQPMGQPMNRGMAPMNQAPVGMNRIQPQYNRQVQPAAQPQYQQRPMVQPRPMAPAVQPQYGVMQRRPVYR